MSATACPCWTNNAALGHEGHCCFLRDDRANVPRDQAWRTDEEACHVPGPDCSCDPRHTAAGSYDNGCPKHDPEAVPADV